MLAKLLILNWTICRFCAHGIQFALLQNRRWGSRNIVNTLYIVNILSKLKDCLLRFWYQKKAYYYVSHYHACHDRSAWHSVRNEAFSENLLVPPQFTPKSWRKCKNGPNRHFFQNLDLNLPRNFSYLEEVDLLCMIHHQLDQMPPGIYTYSL